MRINTDGVTMESLAVLDDVTAAHMQHPRTKLKQARCSHCIYFVPRGTTPKVIATVYTAKDVDYGEQSTSEPGIHGISSV